MESTQIFFIEIYHSCKLLRINLNACVSEVWHSQLAFLAGVCKDSALKLSSETSHPGKKKKTAFKVNQWERVYILVLQNKWEMLTITKCAQ